MAKDRILSGMRPTGKLHLGNLLGALENWKKYQDQMECFFMVADWHALMSEYKDPKELKQNSLECVKDWIAFGLDPEKSVIFIQSDVKEHLELAAVFGALTPIPWLERNPTYKEQLQELKDKDVFTYAFLGYPVLQAADILLYKATKVPVGNDQLPHLELTREIARRFNFLYKEVFPEPQPILTQMARLLGLDNRKMSKSYGNMITLSEPEEVIRKNVKTMITDPARVRLKDPGHPEVCNVFSYHKLFNTGEVDEIKTGCEGATLGCTDCKMKMADKLVEFLKPAQEKRKELDEKKIEAILEDGAQKARKVAQKTIEEVKALVGL